MNKLWMVLLSWIFLAGCNEPEQISGNEFQSKIRSGRAQTMIYAEYLCEADGRLYLSESKMSMMDDQRWIKQFYYAQKSEIDPEFYQTLVAQGDCQDLIKGFNRTKKVDHQ